MLTKLGDLKRGLLFLKRSLTDTEYLYGPSHPMTMNSLETLVQGYFLCHDYRSAMACQRRVLGFNDEKYGAEDPRTKEAGLIMSTLTEKAVAKVGFFLLL
jgi:hypothetical protein